MTFTKEWLQQTIEEMEYDKATFPGDLNEDHGNVLEAMKMALAGMEAESVGEVSEQRDGLILDGTVDLGGTTIHRIINGASKMKRLPLGTKFYTAPQPLTTSERAELENYRNAQQVVPEWTNEQCLEFLSIAFRHAEIKGDLEMDDIRLGVKMVNACRVQGAAGNSPVIPDGWVACSEQMPEDEQEVIVQNKMGYRYVSYFDEHSGLFFDMRGGNQMNCIEHIFVTHWMPLPAAPQQK